MLAPGMETSLQVFFCTDELKDFADTLCIMSNDHLVEVPLFAKGPHAHLELVGDLNFGLIANESTETRRFAVKNTGSLQTEFRLKYEKSVALKIEPAEGVVGGGCEVMLEVTLKPNDLGPTNSPVEVRGRGFKSFVQRSAFCSTFNFRPRFNSQQSTF